MKNRVAYRGQPLFTLVFVLGSWVMLRAATWEVPFGHIAAHRVETSVEQADVAIGSIAGPMSVPSTLPTLAAFAGLHAAETAHRWMMGPAPATAAWTGLAASGRLRKGAAFPSTATPRDPIWLLPPNAGYAQAGDGNVVAAPAAVPVQPLAPAGNGATGRRWSADAWLFLRRGGMPAATSGSSSYGASQFGAVLRYRLAPSSKFRPAVYLRSTGALTAAKDAEAALGIAARPFPGVPISAAAEVRALKAGARNVVRPAAYAVTELPPFKLPLAFMAEAYAQAGYVGGEFATPFIDGQLRMERQLKQLGPATVRAGGGIWGGAQKGASRLDVGPAATLGLRIGKVPSRISVDWRFRVAGNAEPSDGPALTLSTGF